MFSVESREGFDAWKAYYPPLKGHRSCSKALIWVAPAPGKQASS